MRNKWPSSNWTTEEMYPLRSYKFGPYTVIGAANGEGYCDRLYNGWRTHGVVELRGLPTAECKVGVKDECVRVPIRLLNIFTPAYNVTSADIDAVDVSDKPLQPY